MASFIIHYLAGEMFLSGFNNELTNDNKNNFRLGNLVVDTLGVTNYSRDEKLKIKMITHFRNKEDKDKCIQIPNVDKFINKYENLVNNYFSVMGYLFHLYTDKVFFEYLYEDVVDVLDKNLKKTNYMKDNYYVRVHKNNKLFKVVDFYSGSSDGGLYKDYSCMNRYLIEKYSINFNYEELRDFSFSSFNNPGIEEIDYKNIYEVLDKMKAIIKQSFIDGNRDLEVFRVYDIDRFIPRVVKLFNDNYKDNIKELIKKRR